MSSREGTPFLPELDGFSLPPPEALAPALARYRAHFAAKRTARNSETPNSTDIKTIFVHQLKEKDHILIRGQSCQILDIHELGNPHPPRDQIHIVGLWTCSKRKMETVFYRDHSIGVSNHPIPEGTLLSVSAGVLEKGDYTFISSTPCLITAITKPTLRTHSNSPAHISGISLINGRHYCVNVPAKTLLRMSDAPIGPFIPPSLRRSPAQTAIAAAAVWKGYYIVLGGRACRAESVLRKDRCLGGGLGVGVGGGLGVRYQLFIVGRAVEGGERVEGWIDVGRMVQVGRWGVDSGAWGWC